MTQSGRTSMALVSVWFQSGYDEPVSTIFWKGHLGRRDACQEVGDNARAEFTSERPKSYKLAVISRYGRWQLVSWSAMWPTCCACGRGRRRQGLFGGCAVTLQLSWQLKHPDLWATTEFASSQLWFPRVWFLSLGCRMGATSSSFPTAATRAAPQAAVPLPCRCVDAAPARLTKRRLMLMLQVVGTVRGYGFSWANNSSK